MTMHVTQLKESGLKATFQRIQLLENIEKHGHMSIDALYEEVVKTYPSLSLATVYKNITLMVEKSVLVEVPISGKKSKYELAKEDHMHLICTECEEVIDKEHTPRVSSAFNSMAMQESFSLDRQQVNLYGICTNCKGK